MMGSTPFSRSVSSILLMRRVPLSWKMRWITSCCDNMCSLPQCGSGRGTRHGPFWQEKERGQVTMPFLSFLSEEQWQRMMGK